jgi:hypothetical protein
MENINLIQQYGIITGTDKIYGHGYHRFYNKDLLEYKSIKKGAILEIGVAGFNSIEMWKLFFPDAFIYGIDINVEYQDHRLKIYKTDQTDLNNLIKIKNDISHPIFFINDDGSHMPEHQLISFDFLFDNVLQEGGIYIIEDIEVSYWKTGELYGYKTNYGVGHFLSIIEKFKLLVDYVNYQFLNENDKQKLDEKTNFLSQKTKNAILSINFSENCIIIKKKQKSDYSYHNPYGFGHFTQDV